MPAIDEDMLRDLMHRATSDLHAPAGVTAGVITSRRRKAMRTHALSVTAVGVAAATAAGAVAVASGTAHHRATMPVITLTAAQRTLNHLSLAAAVSKHPAMRYVELAEMQGNDKRTTVIDSRTGDMWTYQAGPGIPDTLPVDRHGSPTLAQLAAYPTDPAALRSLLVAQARHDQILGIRAELAQLRQRDPKDFRQVRKVLYASIPKETRSDRVFSQAAYLLWNPLVGAPLRSALFKVLAATPGVVVNASATDSVGRHAVEISRLDRAAGYTEAIYEAPDASSVLETVSIHPATNGTGGLPAQAGYSLNDTYLSMTWTTELPKVSPYGK